MFDRAWDFLHFGLKLATNIYKITCCTGAFKMELHTMDAGGMNDASNPGNCLFGARHINKGQNSSVLDNRNAFMVTSLQVLLKWPIAT